jgi:hypothetical protein
MIAPVRLPEGHSVPFNARPTKEFIEAESAPFCHNITALAKPIE